MSQIAFRAGCVSDGFFQFNEYLNRRIRVATEGHGNARKQSRMRERRFLSLRT